MPTDSLGGTQVPQKFNNEEVVQAHFRMETEFDGVRPVYKLFLRTYQIVDERAGVWHAMPEKEWPLLATILADGIIMMPIHTNPHAQRYLSPKNGRFTTVIYWDEFGDVLLDDAEAAEENIELRLAWRLFDSPRYGLGLTKDLDPVWQGLSRIRDADALVINKRPGMYLKEKVIEIGTEDVDKLRRAFNRVKRNGRQLIRQSKQSIVHDDLLNRLDPERFQRIVRVNEPLVAVRSEGPRQTAVRERKERRSSVASVREHLNELVTEAPQDLLMLHAEIERVTLAKMIEAFKVKLDSKLTEPHWQAFFENNQFVLSMVFARPVELARSQFHAKGSTLRGSGAQIGDFLFKEHGQALAIIEIKTPETELVKGKPYRGEDVFGPHSELSGAVTQVLFQQSELKQRWMMHVYDNPVLRASGADVIKCIVIAGRFPADQRKLRSFEVFRNACKDVEIVTFDELLMKLELLEKQFNPMPEPDIF